MKAVFDKGLVLIALGLGTAIGFYVGNVSKEQLIRKEFAKQGIAKYEIDTEGNPQWKLNCILKDDTK